MPRRRWLDISLARKISLLFGSAVLLTIVVTLTFPRLHMRYLNEEVLLVQAKWVASIVFQSVDLQAPAWGDVQARLDERWPGLVRDLGLPPSRPVVVPVDQPGPGFQSDAITRLRQNPRQSYYWATQDDGRQFRFAMAVRATNADPHPQTLRGIIDIRLENPQTEDFWNSAVTVLAGASGAVLAIIVFYMVTQRLVLMPVTALRRVAERVTGGHLDVRAQIASGDEFQDLAETFNDMLAHLKAAQEELEKTNRSLDIRLGELAETNIALYESNRLKNEFLANVTHELRTPLVSIIGFAELLRDAWENPEADRARLARYSETILVSGRNLMEIINDLLDLAKIEAGKIELHISEFSITELCRDLVDFIQPLADKKKQQLTLRLDRDLPRFRNDSGKLKQILYNLLSNAVKFTPAEGSISLSAERAAGDRVRLAVSDSGPGIPPDQHEAIFEKFRQLDASNTREYEGTGLGLAITRELVQLLGGTISLESAVGQGSRFMVVMPPAVEKPADSARIPGGLRTS